MHIPFNDARWIWSNDDGDLRYAVRRFRGGFTLDSEQSIRVFVCADSRYLLYLNGRLIGRGPARSDVRHTMYDTYDAHLPAGEHLFAAVVVEYSGDSAPVAEMHERGAFLLEAVDQHGSVLTETGTEKFGWKVQIDTAIRPVPADLGHQTYYACGAAEFVDGSKIPYRWEHADFDDTDWEPVKSTFDAYLYGRPSDMADPGGRWRLVERDIPMPYEARCEYKNSPDFPLTVAANTTFDVILDAGHYSNGYPKIRTLDGSEAEITFTYSESLWKNGEKGDRGFVVGGDVIGFSDRYISGGREEAYAPMHWRAFRFVKLTIKTAETPLTVTAMYFIMTGYPWERASEFSVLPHQAQLQEVMDVDFRTLQRCTYETFMDCPYYEQLQYVGDTRLQALLGYVTTGDTALALRAVRLFDWSRIPEGLTQSRYPSKIEQVIPPFSLLWVLMVEDLWRYAPDETDTIGTVLSGCRGILEWFGKHLNPEGVLSGHMPWWHFVDWAEEWNANGGVPSAAAAGVPCSIISLQYLAALQAYVRMHEGLGDTRESEFWQAEADMLADAIAVNFWDPVKKLFMDGPDPQYGYSQHAQAWGILTDLVPKDAISSVVDSLNNDNSLIKTTFYHTFYVVEALAKVGRIENLWSHWLKPWRDALDLGFTTWPEKPNPTRSDCHAWSAWPTYAFLTHVLGAKPGEPGSGDYVVEPNKVDQWPEVAGTVVTPNGLLRVQISWTNSIEPEIKTFLDGDN